MSKMTTHERFTRMFEHREADRVAMWDFPWPGTLARWYREGLPAGVGYEEYFDVDSVGRIAVDSSPLYTERIVEESEKYITKFTKWGYTETNFKNDDSTPHLTSHTITDEKEWLKAKARIKLSADRILWDQIKEDYPKWRSEGRWILADVSFSPSFFMAYVVGTERYLMALLEEPEWCIDMSNHTLELELNLLDMVWEAGYKFDMLNIRDDLAYAHSLFFSIDVYKQVVKPAHKKAVDWAHNKGIKARLHCCGSVEPLLPEIVDVGFDALHPLQIKAGMKPDKVKEAYGDNIVIHGGFDAMLWKDIDAIKAEMDRLMPILKQDGGYIFASDHSIPNDVCFENIKEIIRYAKELGKY